MKILAVDDDPSIREILTLILSASGYDDVTEAASVDAALTVVARASGPFECFIVDIQMPGRDGIELCRDVRNLPGYAKTPIIMLTAMHEREFVEQAFLAGATDYATKPFDIEDLIARVALAERTSADAGESGKMAPHQLSGQARLLERQFRESVAIGNVKNVIPDFVFTNYLEQLSRSGLTVSNLFAIHIQECERFIGRATYLDFMSALEAVANSISEVLRGRQFLLSYIGQGNFICNAFTSALIEAETFERDVQYEIDQIDLEFSDGRTNDLEIVVGQNVTHHNKDKGMIRDSQQSAVRNALERAAQLKKRTRVPSIRLPDS